MLTKMFLLSRNEMGRNGKKPHNGKYEIYLYQNLLDQEALERLNTQHARGMKNAYIILQSENLRGPFKYICADNIELLSKNKM
jgi:hypothetical protein